MCDAVYAMCVERIERQVLADRQIVGVFLAAGAKGVDLPSLDEAIAEFDAQLVAEPKQVDPEKYELMRVLGVA